MKSSSLSLLIIHSAFLLTEGLVFPKYNGVQNRFEQLHQEVPEFKKELSSPNLMPSHSNNNIYDNTKVSATRDYFSAAYTPELNPFVSDSDVSKPKSVQFHANLGSSANDPGSKFNRFEPYDNLAIPKELAGQSVYDADSSKIDKPPSGMNVPSESVRFDSKKIKDNNQAPTTPKKLVKGISKFDDCENHQPPNQKSNYKSNRNNHKFSREESQKPGRKTKSQSYADVRSLSCRKCKKLVTDGSSIPEENMRGFNGNEVDCSESLEVDDNFAIVTNEEFQKGLGSLNHQNFQSAKQPLGTKNRSRRNKETGADNGVSKRIET